jgi:hypothetical protein
MVRNDGGLLFSRPGWLTIRDKPPHPIFLFNEATGLLDVVGMCYEPVILGDSDPPDFVLFNGDLVLIGGQ